MSQAPQQTCSLPPFAGLRVCATPGCGTQLSQYNPDDLCAQCLQREADSETAHSASGVNVERLIAGLLLTHDALHPGEPLDVLTRLTELGIELDCWTMQHAVRRIARRHGVVARGARGGHRGYTVVDWECRYRLAVGAGGVIMDRDPESGRYTRPVALAVAISVAVAGDTGVDRPLQPSLPGFDTASTET